VQALEFSDQPNYYQLSKILRQCLQTCLDFNDPDKANQDEFVFAHKLSQEIDDLFLGDETTMLMMDNTNPTNLSNNKSDTTFL